MKLKFFEENLEKSKNLVQNTNAIQQLFLVNKNKETGEFETLTPPAFCKDYFQDIYFCEYLNKISRFNKYGMIYNKKGIINRKDSHVYIGMYFQEIDTEYKVTLKSLENIIKEYKRFFRSEDFTIEYTDLDLSSDGFILDGIIIVGVPISFLKSAHKFSLIILLLRNFYQYDNENLVDFLFGSKCSGSHQDMQLYFTSAMNVGKRMLSLFLVLDADPYYLDYPAYEEIKIDDISYIHDHTGIQSFMSKNLSKVYEYLNKIEHLINKELYDKYKKVLPKNTVQASLP